VDLRDPIKAGVECMHAWLNPDVNYLPTNGYETAHDLGRWWDAALRMEDAIGLPIPAEIEGAMLVNLERLTDNEDGILMNRAGMGCNRGIINPHNFREGMIAFHALARWRNSAWAAEKGRRLAQTVLALIADDGRCDYTRLGCYERIGFSDDNVFEGEHKGAEGTWFDATASTGRMLEAVIWFHEATQDPIALELARVIADHQLRLTTREDGAIRPELLDAGNPGHCHSFLGTLRGLLQFGRLTDDPVFVQRVAATYDNGIHKQIVREPGWCPHDLGMKRFTDNGDGDPVGEVTSPGDIAQLALWLADATGEGRYLDDVERYVRARLIPAQITQADSECPEIRPHHVGGWGCHFRPHANKRCIVDVVAAVLHSLADVQNHIAVETDEGLRVDLHFNTGRCNAIIHAERTDVASMTVTTEIVRNVDIRVPGWASPESLSVTIDDVPVELELRDGYVHVAAEALTPGSSITVHHDLPERRSEATMPSGKQFEIGWKGDDVIGISPNEGTRCFYPDL